MAYKTFFFMIMQRIITENDVVSTPNLSRSMFVDQNLIGSHSHHISSSINIDFFDIPEDFNLKYAICVLGFNALQFTQFDCNVDKCNLSR